MQSRRSFAYFILSRVLIFGLISSIPSFQAQAQIAFTSERNGNKEIYVMDADGRNPRNVTKNPADDWTPSWSPDCKRIAFMSNRDNNNEIYVMDADGGNPQRLTIHPWSDGSPSWSPIGEHIAFNTARLGNDEIYVMNVDGRNQRNLTKN